MISDVIANRVYDFIMENDYYNAMDDGVIHDQVKTLLVNSPETIIEMLLDYFEEV